MISTQALSVALVILATPCGSTVHAKLPPGGLPDARKTIFSPIPTPLRPEMLTLQHFPATEYGGQLQPHPAILSPAPGSVTIVALSSWTCPLAMISKRRVSWLKLRK